MRNYQQSIRNYFQKITLVLSILCSIQSQFTFAQIDTSAPQSVTIISSYKPVMRSAAKINFSSSTLSPDSSKNLLPYKIPVQHLYYAYQPIAINALSLNHDGLLPLGDHYLIKVGYGNFKTPFLSAAANFGDGQKTMFNFYTNYSSSKGKIKNQDYSNLLVKATGSYFTEKHESYGGIAFNRNQNYLYGYDHKLYDFSKADISQQAQCIDVALGYRNIVRNNWGVDYNPNFHFNVYKLKEVEGLTETSFKIQLPAEKKITDYFTAKIEANADLTNYTTKSTSPTNYNFKNNLFSVKPTLQFNKKHLSLTGGVIATSDNGKMTLLPNVIAGYSLAKEKINIQAGCIGTIYKNTFENLSFINPFLNRFAQSPGNTKESEWFGGVKSTISKHIYVTVKASYLHYTNFQLMINDTAGLGNRFNLSNEPGINNFRLHGEVSYVIRQKFNLTGGINFNGYTGMKNNDRAFNTVPVECNIDMNWAFRKRWQFKSDFYFFGGGHYLEKNNESVQFSGAADWSLGVTYKINNRFDSFLQLNNIFGNKYERWHNYPVYGLNAVAGVSARF
jgi:hypothetical protein